METTSDVNFVYEYEPGGNAHVELINGRIVDVINATYMAENVKLIVKGGRIAAMPGLEGQPADITPDFIIDLKGKTVLPGLMNTHCHTTQTAPSFLPDIRDIKHFKTHADNQMERNMAECLLHGITTVRDTWAADLRIVRTLREKIEKKAVAGPRIMQAVAVGPPGGYLTEEYGLIMRWMRSKMGVPSIDYEQEYSGTIVFPVDATGPQVRDAVDRAIDERGAEAIKIGEQKENMTNFKPDATIMTLNQLTAIADQASKRKLKSTIHHTSVASFRRALNAGVSSLAHVACDDLLTDDDIALFLKHDAIIEPTMSVAYDMSYPIEGEPGFDDPYLKRLTEFRNRVHDDVVKEYWIPEFEAVARSYLRKANDGNMRIFGLLPMKKMYRNCAAICTVGGRNFRSLFESGVRMAASNDGGIPPCTVAMLQHEIDLLDLFLNQASGKDLFSGADAVKMATINAATCLGLEEDFGTIETGKVADLVIIDGDPLEDHRRVGRPVAALFMDGQLLINNCKLRVVAAGRV